MNIAVRIIALALLIWPVTFAGAQDPTVLKHDGWVAAVAFSPDGKTLASAGADNVVRLWEAGTWKPKGVLKGHTDCVCAIAFFRDNNKVATGSYDHTFRIWDFEKQKQIEFGLHEMNGVVCSVAIKHVRDHLAVGCVDGTVRTISWEVALGKKEPVERSKASKDHRSWVNSVAWNPRGAELASGSSDGTVHVWRIFAGKNSKPTVLEGGAGEVRSITFTPIESQPTLLAAGNRYGTIRIWERIPKTPQPEFKEVKTLTGHMGEVWAIAFSPDGKTLAAVDTEWKKPSKIKLYDTTTWQERGSLPMPGEILCLAYSPDGAWLAAGSWDKTVRLFPIKR